MVGGRVAVQEERDSLRLRPYAVTWYRVPCVRWRGVVCAVSNETDSRRNDGHYFNRALCEVMDSQ